MAQLSLERIEKTSQELMSSIESQLKGYKFIVVIHDGTNLQDKLLRDLEDKLRGHASLKAMRHIAAKAPLRPFTAFLGAACSKQKGFLGLSENNDHLALIAINKNEIERANELESLLYRAVSETLDAAAMYEKQKNIHGSQYTPIIQRKKALARSHANLKADMFCALMFGLKGDKSAIETLAKTYGKRVLAPKTRYLPEEYPYIMAMEALQFAFQDLGNKTSKSQYVNIARDISAKTMQTFELSQIYQWWNFARPAQDMAWRGYSDSEILGLAINTSDDPHVRSTGMLISEILNVEPIGDTNALNTYNAFANTERNVKAHKKAIDALLEEIVEETSKSSSSEALYEAANRQNMGLAEGKILGWCAHALQHAAHAYDKAKQDGIEALDIMRSEFTHKIEEGGMWDTLKTFSDIVVKNSRKKGLLTIDDTVKIAESDGAFDILKNSILQSLSDPRLQAKLAAANDMAPTAGLAPTAPSAAPSQAPKAPQIAATYAAPSPGGMGGSNAGNAAAARKAAVKADDDRAEEENASKEDA